jgi:translation initiation factor 3 subunit D
MKSGERLKFDEPNPFSEGVLAIEGAEGEQLSSSAYRYRQWSLNDEDEVDIVVRCEVDGVLQVKGEDQLILIKALNETDLRTQDWRKKIESQRGAVLAFETKNNKNKVAKWTAAALLAGADMLKLGYVSRSGPKDNSNHIILGTQACKPKEFASQITLNMDHCWGIVRALVDMLLKLDDGKFLLLKDPNKELLRVYNLGSGEEI